MGDFRNRWPYFGCSRMMRVVCYSLKGRFSWRFRGLGAKGWLRESEDSIPLCNGPCRILRPLLALVPRSCILTYTCGYGISGRATIETYGPMRAATGYRQFILVFGVAHMFHPLDLVGGPPPSHGRHTSRISGPRSAPHACPGGMGMPERNPSLITPCPRAEGPRRGAHPPRSQEGQVAGLPDRHGVAS